MQFLVLLLFVCCVIPSFQPNCISVVSADSEISSRDEKSEKKQCDTCDHEESSSSEECSDEEHHPKPPPPKCYGENEIPTNCYHPCEKTCRTRFRHDGEECSEQKCEVGCTCADGYLRHDDGTCVPVEECSIPQCDDGERYTKCGTPCEDTCDNRNDTCHICKFECSEGCFCKRGLIRSRNGACVKPDQCPPRTCQGHNEYFDQCPRTCPPQECSIDRSTYDCSNARQCCHPQCRCMKGFLRNANGVCIPKSRCPILPPPPDKCGANEIWSECMIVCPPQTCRSMQMYNYCEHSGKCIPGCNCKSGYLRNGTDVDDCIPSTQCPPLPTPQPEPECPNEDEEYTECTLLKCNKTCDDLLEPPPCDDVSANCYQPGCLCPDDWVWTKNGTCVPPSECPPPKCAKNEKWNDCGTEATCDNYNDTNRPQTQQCVSGCFCESGLVRSANKSCINPENCPSKPTPPEECGSNEIWEQCENSCEPTCETCGQNKSCSTPNDCSKGGCSCAEGFARNGTKEDACIPISECPEVTTTPTKCADNENWNDCGTACEANCDNYNDTNRPCTQQCVSGCFCKSGLVRSANKSCISPEKCQPNSPPECREYEEYTTCTLTKCWQTCEHVLYQPECPTIHPGCYHPGCVCIDGYVKSPNNTCIDADDCLTPPTKCAENENWEECGTACAATCDNYNETKKPCEERCVSGCFCKPEFVKSANNTCISPENCPPKPTPPEECGSNEIWEQCENSCEPTCETYGQNKSCSTPNDCSKGGCSCAGGFTRNGTKEDACIPISECPKETTPPTKCAENENWEECGTACAATCDNYNETKKPCEERCVSGCFCKPEFVMSANKTCISPENCPPKPTPPEECGSNEIWEQCENSCEPTCETYGQNKSCSTPNDCSKGGCSCAGGFARNGTRKDACIPISECPKETTPPTKCAENEYWEECGTACAATCDNYNETKKPCEERCVSGCFCKPEFVMSANKTCISPENCPPKPTPPEECGSNEIWEQCENSCEPTCETYGQNKSCSTPNDCSKGGCSCAGGFARNGTRKDACIPISECPKETTPPTKCAENENWEECGTACAATCDNYNETKKPCEERCVSGCFCKPEFVKSANNTCISPENCPPKPTPPEECGSNEIWEQCENSCEPTCETYGQNKSCSTPNDCSKGGCSCAGGFTRNGTRKDACIPISECPKETTPPTKCAENENWEECGTACAATCDNYNETKKPCEERCVSGCFCKPEFVKSANNTCISPENCPPKPTPPEECGSNEIWEQCENSCEPTCETYGQNKSCSTPNDCSKGGCSCAGGFTRNGTRKDACIPISECPKETTPPTKCAENENWEECGTACAATCDNYNETKKPCEERCVSGCFCKPEFVKSANNTCISPENCPPKPTPPEECGSNEIWEQCENSCEPTCETYGQNKSCSTPNDCSKGGCSCAGGFTRNGTRKDACIPISECPKETTPPTKCAENENWEECGTACAATCDNYNETKKPCEERCVSGCFCKPEFVKSANNTCISPENCPPKPTPPEECGSNEIWEQCENSCEPTCETYGQNKSCSTPNDCSKGGCSCAGGFTRNGTRKDACIPISECPKETTPPTKCAENENWEECGTACAATCDNYNETKKPCEERCVSGCFCKPEFVMSANKTCISPENCPPKPTPPEECGSNEIWEQCENSCEPTCETYGQNKSCSTPNDCSKGGCSCAGGFTRNGTRKDACIPISECPKETTPPTKCAENENWEECGTACAATCDNYNETKKPCEERCVSGCFCKPEFVKSANNTCISPENCPPKPTPPEECGSNEIWEQCENSCEPTCETYGQNKSCSTPKDCSKGGCSCAGGFTRNGTRKDACIPISECPKETTPPTKCAENENWEECGTACAATCDNYNETKKPCEERCVSGCFCKPEFVKSANNTCISPENCPPKPTPPEECGSNEIWEQCENSCEPTCETYGQNKSCSTPKDCSKGGCSCAGGFTRNGTRKDACIPISECPKETTPPTKCAENENWEECGTACAATCDNYNETKKPCEERCVSGCFCKPEFVKSANNTCISPENCPPKPTPPEECGSNEIWEQCENSCEPTCETYGQNKSCSTPNDCSKGGCSCAGGFTRNGTRKDACIPISECPKETTPPTKCAENENWEECGTACAATCDNYNETKKPCEERCVSGCFCKPEFVKSANNTCISPENCPPKPTPPEECGSNEIWEQCENPCEPTCETYGQNKSCSTPNDCSKGGCSCAGGFARNGTKEDACIPISECPKETTPPPPPQQECRTNEIYSNCTLRKCYKNCKDLISQPPCPVVPPNCNQPGCVCKGDWLRNNKGICVPQNQCPYSPPQQQCQKDEIYSDCTLKKCYQNCTDLISKPACRAVPSNCNQPGCVCKDDWLRLSDGTCVPSNQCPSPPKPECGSNEVYSNCTLTKCYKNCKDLIIKPNCPKVAQNCTEPGCVCRSDWLKLENGTCVPSNQCPSPPKPECGSNEVYSNCTLTKCYKNCKDLIIKPNCPKVAQNCTEPGCVCRSDWLKLENGTCVPSNQCPSPPKPECGSNEVYSNCTLTKCYKNCKDLIIKPNCSKVAQNCTEPGCVCRSDWLKLENGTCVPSNQCPSPPKPECGSNEVYSNCTLTKCYKNCKDLIIKPNCPKVAQNCTEPGCVCRSDWLKLENGTCVPSNQCPSPPKPECGSNEVYSNCTLTKCYKNCKDLIIKPNCSKVAQNCTEPGCVCRSDWLKLENGTCVPSNQCPSPPKPECGSNEVYSNCTLTKCYKNCKDLIIKPNCSKVAQNCTEPGCVCRSDWLKLENGTCVPSNQCPSPPKPECGSNEVYSNCTLTKCYKNCKDLIIKPNCPKVAQNCTEPGCVCRSDWLKLENGTCVPSNQCPSPPKPECGSNEVYSNCTLTKCYKNCKDLIIKPNCPKVAQNCTEPGCVCRSDWLKLENGTCVPSNQCPSPPKLECGSNEVYSNCTLTKCYKNCKDLIIKPNCSKVAQNCTEPGCVCRSDWLKLENGTCVPSNQCPSPPKPECGSNEVYSNCTLTKCYKNCKDLIIKPNCPKVAQNCTEPGCVCRSDWLKLENGTCVPSNQCPSPPKPECGSNEVYSNCTLTKCYKNCKDLIIKPNCPKVAQNCTEPGCVCRSDWLKLENGTCVPSNQCPSPPKPECGSNEVYSNCTLTKCYKNCKDLIIKPNCPKVAQNCTEPGCVCRSDWLKLENGTCVPSNQCPSPPKPECGSNEVYSNCTLTKCYKNCKDLIIKPNCPKVAQNCTEPGCVCRSDWLKLENGTCVPSNQCPSPPKPECGSNEVYSNCTLTKCYKNCKDLIIKPNCPKVAQNCTEPGCVCRSDWLKLENGTCVPSNQCPSPPKPECGSNEVYSNCTLTKCYKNCKDLIIKPNCPKVAQNCTEPGCVCRSDWLKLENGTCVPSNQCPSPPKPECGSNEVYSNCTLTKCYKNCKDLIIKPNCPKVAQNCTEPGCVCRSDWLKLENGTCVPSNQCPSPPKPECGSNEVYSNCTLTKCYKNCKDLIIKPNCPKVAQNCTEPGCVCRSDWLKLENGTCVPSNQCPSPPKPECGSNEVYSNCTLTKCYKNCKDLIIKPNCPKVAQNCTEPGCVCRSDWLKLENGTCVPSNQCPSPPKPECGSNEVYSNCTLTKCYKNCKDLIIKPNCPKVAQNCTEPGCVCRSDWLKLENGTCVPSNQCPSPPKPECGSNEVYSNCTLTKCYKNCKDLIIKPNCPKVAQNCTEPGCVCRSDWLKLENGTCVPSNQCPSPPKPECGSNEVYSNCTLTKCYKNCKDLIIKPNCPKVAQNCTEPGCVCRSDWLKLENGTCVPSNQCPSPPKPECGSNEVYSNCTLTKCYKNCKDLIIKPNCPKVAQNCTEPGCVCRSDWLKLENGTCVPSNQCPSPPKPECGSNEVYSNCTLTKCYKNCKDLIIKPNCPKVAQNCTEPGCVCRSDWLKLENGTCVPSNQCPSPPKPECGSNEVYSNCTLTKCYKNCKDLIIKPNCPKVAQNCTEPGCVCRSDWLKLENGTCVPSNQCPSPPKPECGSNEVYSNCTLTKCYKNCKDLIIKPNCPKVAQNCTEPGCVCRSDWLKLENGTCVPSNQCPSPKPQCAANEVYSNCTLTKCYKNCKDLIIKPYCPNVAQNCTVPGCVCKSDWLKLENGTCVPSNQCPNAACPKNESYVVDWQICEKTCSNKNEPSRQCNKITGCICNPGLVRNNQGKCVPPAQCYVPPPTGQCGKNELWKDCRTQCPPQTCNTLYTFYNCQANITCQAGCDCAKGYLRNGTENSPCIPSTECPKQPPITCSTNETYVENEVVSLRTCENRNHKYCACEATTGCVCKQGFVKNNDRECVAPRDCPAPVCWKYEEPSDCIKPCTRTCRTRFRSDGRICRNDVCKVGCKCIEGYLRHDNGSCVPVYECSAPICNHDEYHPECGPSCEPSCSSINNTCNYCPKRCTDGCFCKPGLVRAADSFTCVKPEQCLKPDCGPNERYERCPKTCPPQTCKAHLAKSYDCSSWKQCCRPQCRCNDGYYRDNQGVCIPETQCKAPV